MGFLTSTTPNDNFYISDVIHSDSLDGIFYFKTKTTSRVICKLCEDVVKTIETPAGFRLPVVGEGELAEIICDRCGDF